MFSFRHQDKKHKCKRKKSKDGFREISNILASDGTVAGKGEQIEKKSKKKVEKVDVVTQVDSFTIEFEINQASLDLDLIRRKADYAPIPNQFAAQLIDRLYYHKRTLQRESNVEMSSQTIYIQNLPRTSSEIKTFVQWCSSDGHSISDPDSI